MKQGTANLAEDDCFIHKALRPVGTARRQIAAVPPSNSRPAVVKIWMRTMTMKTYADCGDNKYLYVAMVNSRHKLI